MPDPVNPYAPSGLDRLSMMLMALGSGVSSAEASGRSGWAGIGPAAGMYGQAMGQANQQAMQYGMWQQQQAEQKAYRQAQEENLRSQIDERKRAAGLEEKLMGMIPGLMGQGGGVPGMGAPPATPTMGPGGDYFSITGNAESGGKYNIANAKGSGAYGKYQFMPDTWASVAPSLGLPFNIRQATPEQQEAAMRELTKRNAQTLGTNSPEALYLAHRFGPNGAKTVMSADPATPIASLFPANWAQQNPDMQGVTVGQFRQTAQQRFGGASPPNAQGQGDAAGGGTPMPGGTGPQIPGPPPDPTRYAPLAMSPRTAPIGTILRDRDKSRHEYDWKTYDATRDQGNKDRDYDFNVRKYQGEGEWVRGADGVEKWTPKSGLSPGMTRTDKPPEPGTPAGDVAVLSRALKDPSYAGSPEYAATYNRAKAHLIDGPNGLKYAPDMSAYPAPSFRQDGTAPPAAVPAGAPARPADATGMVPVGDKNYTESQNRDFTYAARLANAIPQLEALVKGEDGKLSTKRLPTNTQQTAANSAYYPESFVGDSAKEFRRIVKDIMTATLRRESGATIQDHEFVAEAQKFIPQPGDSESLIASKLQALRLAARSIAEGSGRPLTHNDLKNLGEQPPAKAAPVRIDMSGKRQ